ARRPRGAYVLGGPFRRRELGPADERADSPRERGGRDARLDHARSAAPSPSCAPQPLLERPFSGRSRAPVGPHTRLPDRAARVHRLFAGFLLAFGGSDEANSKPFLIHRARSFGCSATSSGITTYSFICMPLTGEKMRAPS